MKKGPFQLMLAVCAVISGANLLLWGAMQNLPVTAQHILSPPELRQPPLPPPPRLDRPTFFLHVGPHKTATTFLQNSLCEKVNVTQPLFLQDNLVYIGNCYLHPDRSEFFHDTTECAFTRMPKGYDYVQIQQGSLPNRGDDDNNYPFDPHFVSLIQNLRSTGRNVLMSNEACVLLTRPMIARLKELLISTWNVKILVVHRNFPDWLVSLHNQWHKLKKEERMSWKKKVSPFDLQSGGGSIGTRLFNAIQDQTTRRHPAQIIQQLFQEHFDSVELIPLNDLDSLLSRLDQQQSASVSSSSPAKGDPLLEYVLCYWVKATHSCQQARSGILNSQIRNSYQDINFDILAQEAYSQGLVPQNSNRIAVARDIASIIQKQREKPILPLKCPSNDTLKRFKRVSIDVDSKIYEWNDARKAAYEETFQRMVDKRVLCYVDAKAVWENHKWRTDFQELGQSQLQQ